MRTYTLNLSTNSKTNPPTQSNVTKTLASWNVNWRELFGEKTGECCVRALLQTISLPIAPTGITFTTCTYTFTSITLNYTGGIGTGLTYTYAIQNMMGTAVTGFTTSGYGTGTTISGLTSTPCYITLTISNLAGSVSNSILVGALKIVYTFENGTTGSLINDTTGQYCLSPTGSPSLNSSIVKYGSHSVYVNGTSRLDCNATYDWDLLFTNSAGYSCALWIYPTVNSNNDFIEIMVGLFVDSSNYLNVSGYFGARGSASNLPNLVPLNTWTHICVTYDNPSGNYLVYVNNALISMNGNSMSSDYFYAEGISLGVHNGNTSYFDSVYIYNRVLSSTEVTSLYNNTDVAY